MNRDEFLGRAGEEGQGGQECTCAGTGIGSPAGPRRKPEADPAHPRQLLTTSGPGHTLGHTLDPRAQPREWARLR